MKPHKLFLIVVCLVAVGGLFGWYRSELSKSSSSVQRVLWGSPEGLQDLRVDREVIAGLSEEERALLALFTYDYGTTCQWDDKAPEDQSGLKCVLNDALGLGYQCSAAQLALLAKYFDRTFAFDSCPTTSWTSTNQRGLEELSFERLGDHRYSVYYRYFSKYRDSLDTVTGGRNYELVNGKFETFNNAAG